MKSNFGNKLTYCRHRDGKFNQEYVSLPYKRKWCASLPNRLQKLMTPDYISIFTL
jgi:hypothetical protein